MNEKYEALYSGLLRDTSAIWTSDLPEVDQAESCFQACVSYWAEVKKIVREDAFASDREEIRFFKYFKPRFTGQLEFYSLVYGFLLFYSSTDPKDQPDLISKELAKIERFREFHQDFITYYGSGDVSQDAILFLRREYTGENAAHAKIYDLDEQVTTSKDWILSQLSGYGLYKGWLEGREVD